MRDSRFECVGETFVTGIWKGYDAAYRGEPIPIPSQFEEVRQRQIDHFSALLAVVEEAAQPMGLSQPDFERWLPRAQAAVEKARAIIEQRPDPLDPAS